MQDMTSPVILTGETEDAIFKEIDTAFTTDEGLLAYSAVIRHGRRDVILVIDIDPGGGFESGYATTMMSAVLRTTPSFKFAIHHQGVLDEIGKFFGMQDVPTGFPEFDKKVIVKSDHPENVKVLFDDPEVRKVFGDLYAFDLSLQEHTNEEDRKQSFLEFTIERGILDARELQHIYAAFIKVLNKLEPVQ